MSRLQLRLERVGPLAPRAHVLPDDPGLPREQIESLMVVQQLERTEECIAHLLLQAETWPTYAWATAPELKRGSSSFALAGVPAYTSEHVVMVGEDPPPGAAFVWRLPLRSEALVAVCRDLVGASSCRTS